MAEDATGFVNFFLHDGKSPERPRLDIPDGGWYLFNRNMLIGFIQQGSKYVIPRSEATWESPGTAYKFATFYQEIATPLRARNDRGNLKRLLLFELCNRPTLQWYVIF